MTQLFPADQFDFGSLLTEPEQAAILRLRQTLDTHVRPIVNEYWGKDEFPLEVIPKLVELGMMNPKEIQDAGAEPTQLFAGFRTYELARCDASMSTFYNAVSGLFRTTVNLGGSPEQVADLDPKVQSFDLFGVFCLTEADHGSDIARGLETSAVRNGDTWTINGSKRWIGGVFAANTLAIFARDVADGHVKCFLVPKNTPGVSYSKIEGKTALKIMQNADIVLENVTVSESVRLQNINSFADVAGLLRNTRSDVSWIACGAMAGAYEAALTYVMHREQFGKPIASFQLIQEKLARMLANCTSALALTVRLTQQQQAGVYLDENSAMAKMQTSLLLRETAALAREVVGGNGIVLDYDVARFFADAEAIYSYEGTHEINSLVVGRAITGIGSFK
jgi:glutaryl-CoA dehydrogenase